MWGLERESFLRSGRGSWKGCFQYKNQEGLVDKKDLTEQEIRTRYITPAIRGAGWPHSQLSVATQS
jgi:hypothetical protein